MIHPSVEQFVQAMAFAGLADCPQDSRWQIPTDSDICTEVETIAFVFGIVRMLRPRVVVETGSNVGCVTQAILAALDANGDGVLYTCDTDRTVLEQAMQRGNGRGRFFHQEGLWLVQHTIADLYWIDSSEDSRAAELAWLRENGKKGAVVLTHDTSLMGGVAEAHLKLPNSILLPGPRGVGIAVL